MLTHHDIERLRHAVAALRYRDGGLRRLARATGVSYSWITKFSTGRTRNEKVDALCRLSQALAAAPRADPAAAATAPRRTPAG